MTLQFAVEMAEFDASENKGSMLSVVCSFFKEHLLFTVFLR